MASKHKLVITTPSDTEIAMTRAFDAPRALVWEMFTRPEHLKQWWGHGFQENTKVEIDLRVGGKYRYEGKTADGTLVPFCGEYKELDPPSRIVFTEIYDVDGARDNPALVTTTFTEQAGTTTMHLVAKFDSKQTRDMVLASGMEHGAAAGYDEIERMVGDLAQVTITREFAAPRALVWQAWTDGAQFAKWFGPRGFTVASCELDVRSGGTMRYEMRGGNMTMTNVGTFKEVVAPERLAYTERYEEGGIVMFENLNTVTFVEHNGKTRVTLDVRLVHAAPGMPKNLDRAGQGWAQAFDKLGELLTR